MSTVPNRDRPSAAADAAEQRAAAPVPREREDAALPDKARRSIALLRWASHSSRAASAWRRASHRWRRLLSFSSPVEPMTSTRSVSSRPLLLRERPCPGLAHPQGQRRAACWRAAALVRRVDAPGRPRSGWAHPRHHLFAPTPRVRNLRKTHRRSLLQPPSRPPIVCPHHSRREV